MSSQPEGPAHEPASVAAASVVRPPRAPVASVGPVRARWGATLLPLGVVLALAVLFRLPALLNAGAINSDAAIVGLQGQHLLHGEWAWHLWGTDYQGALDSLLVGLSTAVLGIKPIAVFVVPLIGLLLMVAVAFDVLRRHVGSAAAAMLVMPLVFAPMASNLPMVYVMRQTLATTLTVGIWLADKAGRSKGPRLYLALAGAAFALGLYIDFFALVTLPAALLFVLACALDPAKLERAALGRLGRGVVLGAAAVSILVLASGVVPLARVAANAKLMMSTCLPFALGTKVFIKGEELVAQPWSAPPAVFLLQIIGAFAFSASILVAGPAAFWKRIPWDVRKLGLYGLSVTLSTLAAFLVSTKPVDMWSSRYLAPMFWVSPFTLAPLGYVLSVRVLALVHAPYWMTALIGGWLSYGLYVDGPMPRVHPRAVAHDEQVLMSELLAAGVHEGEAQYWLAYRLTFLWNERIVVVPIDRKGDRYRPYRERVDAAPVRALIFHPSEPRAAAEPYESDLRAAGASYERREVASFTVLLVHR